MQEHQGLTYTGEASRRIVVSSVAGRSPEVPSTGFCEAALHLDGRELLRGNRSRIVFLAGELRARLARLAGDVQIAVIRKEIGPSARAIAYWTSQAPVTLRFAACFGGGKLVDIRIGGQIVQPATLEVATVAKDVRVAMVVEGRPQASAEIVLLLERSQQDFTRVAGRCGEAEARTPKDGHSGLGKPATSMSAHR